MAFALGSFDPPPNDNFPRFSQGPSPELVEKLRLLAPHRSATGCGHAENPEIRPILIRTKNRRNLEWVQAEKLPVSAGEAQEAGGGSLKGTPLASASRRRRFQSVHLSRSSACPCSRPSARRFSMSGSTNLLPKYRAVTIVSPPITSIALMVSIAYMRISDAAGAAALTTAMAVPAIPSCFRLETSAHAMSAVQLIVSTKIKAKHQGSHFRAMLRGDSRCVRSESNNISAQNHQVALSVLRFFSPLLP